jgi:hypothetical protein
MARSRRRRRGPRPRRRRRRGPRRRRSRSRTHRRAARPPSRAAGDRVGRGEQRTGAVLAVEAHLEGLLAGGQRRPLAVGLLASSRTLASRPRGRRAACWPPRARRRGPPRPRRARRPGSRATVKSRWAARRGPAPPRGGGQPADLVLGGGGAAAQRVDLAVQAGQTLSGGRAAARLAARRPGRSSSRRRPSADHAGRYRGVLAARLRVDLGGDPALLLA